MVRSRVALRRRGLLPEGTTSVATGLVVTGISTYVFLVVAARALGPENYAPLSVLWALVFLTGPGFFMPVEQEVARALSARRVRGTGGRPLVRRAATLAGCLLLVQVGVTLVLSPTMLDRLFDHELALLAAFLLAMTGSCAGHLWRGTLSGHGQFRPYGLYLAVEGLARVLAAVALALLGVRMAGPYGLAVGLAPFLALIASRWGQRDLLRPGVEAPWRELSAPLLWLLAGSVLSQTLINGGTVAVRLLASEQTGETGRFLAALLIARIPLFMFQALQAALLPKLSGLAASGRLPELRAGLRRLLLLITISALTALMMAAAGGPFLVRLLFGPDFAVGRRTVILLTLAVATYVVALCFAQALIALSGHRRLVVGWGIGVAAAALGLAVVDDLFLRVEVGLVLGSSAAAASMALSVAGRLRTGAGKGAGEASASAGPIGDQLEV